MVSGQFRSNSWFPSHRRFMESAFRHRHPLLGPLCLVATVILGLLSASELPAVAAAGTTTSVSASPSPAVAGQSVTLTALTNAPGAVTFTYNGQTGARARRVPQVLRSRRHRHGALRETVCQLGLQLIRTTTSTSRHGIRAIVEVGGVKRSRSLRVVP